jgi:hypothetical protein
MATQVVILRAVRDFVPHLARLKNATMAFFNGLLGPRSIRQQPNFEYHLHRGACYR